jgi:hypothetical protein
VPDSRSTGWFLGGESSWQLASAAACRWLVTRTASTTNVCSNEQLARGENPALALCLVNPAQGTVSLLLLATSSMTAQRQPGGNVSTSSLISGKRCGL